MSNNSSVLLPGTFFEQEYKRKLEYLSRNNVNCVYLYDHSVNPSDNQKTVYKIKKSLSLLQEYENKNFNLGLCVLNINSRKKDLLFSKFINPMMEIENFKLGLGTGDKKYENRNTKYSYDLDQIIHELINLYTFSSKGKNLFLGGTSKNKKELVRKYSIGINQWLGSSKDLISFYKSLHQKQSLIGKFSQCLKPSNTEVNLPKNFEKIFILKDSNLGKFYSDVDKIFS